MGSKRIVDPGASARLNLVSQVVLAIVSVLAVSVWLTSLYLPAAMRGSAIDAAYRANVELADMVKSARDYYAENVASKAVASGKLIASSSHAGDPHAIPFPATFVKDLSETFKGKSASIALVSPYPWPHRAGRTMDAFELQAWEAFQTNPNAVFSREDSSDGVRTLRIAIADRMTSDACISCHNKHPLSAKRDWKVGDVRGVLAVTRVVEPALAAAEMRSHMIVVYLVVAAILASAALLGATLLIERYSSEKSNATAALAHSAHHDALTGLPNRVQLQARIEDALAAQPQDKRSAVLFLDLDGFKEVNDSCGHDFGDLLLKEVACRLRGCLPDADTAARWGGDEFVVVHMSAQPERSAAELARQFAHALEQPFLIGGRHISIGVSIGIAVAGAGEMDPARLLKEADIAAYHAKSNSRGGHCFFAAEMDAHLVERRWIAGELQRALIEQPSEMEVHYQPIVDAKTRKIVAMEALARWRHPVRGMIGPDRFIPVAEETGLISVLGELVLRESCRTAVNWPADVAVSVNLSATQFQNRSLVDAVLRILAETGLPAKRLELEITESVVLSRNGENIAALHKLRDTGISIALDDFGTGYSSLTYLQVFPFNKIKIDRTFVRELSSRDDCGAIVCAIASLGLSLGMVTTAEGVETPEQLEPLRAAGVTLVQGYLFGRPSARPEFGDKTPVPSIAASDSSSASALNSGDIMLVRSTFAKLLPLQSAVAGLFYDRLFQIAPELREMFPADLTMQKEKLMDMLAAGIGKLHDLASLTEVLKALGARHRGYGTTAAHYDLVAQALISTLEQGLGSAFTPDVRAAWVKVYVLLATTMQSGADYQDRTRAA